VAAAEPRNRRLALTALRPLSSLRSGLLLLVLLAMLPALALILSTALEQRRQALSDTEADALRLARVAASDHERLIEGARSLLVGLAQLSDVQMHNSRACSALFSEVQRQFPLYSNIGAIRPDGDIFCSARSRRAGQNVARELAFHRALTSHEFSVSGYYRDSETGRPRLTLAYPAVDRAGATWAVVYAQLDLGWMAQLADKARLYAGTVVNVTDADGRILARYPDPGGWTGKSAPEWAVVKATASGRGEGTLQAVGLEGQERLFGFAPLFTSRPEPVYVSVGIPADAALAGANRLLVRNLLWAALVVVLMLGAAAVVSDLLILRRMEAVVEAARQLSAGNLAARAAVRGADEIAVMARTFNAMAERLQARVRDEETIKEGLAERVTELHLLNRMGELFQSCLSLAEAYDVIGRLAPQLFPTESGAVLAVAPTGALIEVAVKWGARPVDATVFALEECWALRNGRPHVVDDIRAGVLCQHLPTPPPTAYVCVPLVPQGTLLGALHVATETGSDGNATRGLSQAKQRLAEAVAAQLGLGLANVQLREMLRVQSLHDSLTGLFNRRYMAETLEREVHRARRAGSPMSILMLDIDGFKLQNDSFGHDAGDALLRAIAGLLQVSLRKEDIACRYGGEEFVLVLPEAALPDAARRAEQIREAVKAMTVPHRNLHLGPVTVSIGVAAFPEHGIDATTLIKSADSALYEAKRQGRDRVTLATPLSPTLSAPEPA
jgi:diguanylate cyclase (GGDEF)-like protein